MTEQQVNKPESGSKPGHSVKKPEKRSNYLVIRIFGDKNLIELKKDLIIYGNNHFPLFFRKFYIRVIEKTYRYPIILLFIILILFFILNVILVLWMLYYTNQQKNHKDRYIRIFEQLYEGVLRSYLFGEINWAKTVSKLKRLEKPQNRKILTAVLINFQENLRGEMDNRIPEIFVQLGLHNDSIKLTRSSVYYHRVQGIRELTNLYPKVAENIIEKYINNPNDLVRAEAQTSYIRIHPEDPFGFLKKLTSPFTRWTQLTAFYLFRQHQITVPSFVNYLDSDNKNVRNFSLRMIIFFQQLENAGAIFEMLNSTHEMTRFLSIRAINDLRLFEGKELLKKQFRVETSKNRLEIIKTIKTIGNAEDFEFLESILIQSESISEKTEACRSLNFLNKDGKKRVNLLNQHAGLEIDQYLAHVTDPRN